MDTLPRKVTQLLKDGGHGYQVALDRLMPLGTSTVLIGACLNARGGGLPKRSCSELLIDEGRQSPAPLTDEDI